MTPITFVLKNDQVDFPGFTRCGVHLCTEKYECTINIVYSGESLLYISIKVWNTLKEGDTGTIGLPVSANYRREIFVPTTSTYEEHLYRVCNGKNKKTCGYWENVKVSYILGTSIYVGQFFRQRRKFRLVSPLTTKTKSRWLSRRWRILTLESIWLEIRSRLDLFCSWFHLESDWV